MTELIECSRCGRTAAPGSCGCNGCGERFCSECENEGPSAHPGSHVCESEICGEGPAGRHEPNAFTVQAAGGVTGIVDIRCKHCGVSGSFSLRSVEINW